MPEITSPIALLALTGVLAYLLGSVPFGVVIARAFGLGDLRKIGSGNIGATNVLRTGNKLAAFLTLVLDAGKGGIAVLIARYLVGEDAAQVAGACAFLGHLFPIWLGFKGGKGMATFLGTALALAWPVGIAASLTWLVVALIFRFSSLAALASAALSPVWALVLGHRSMALVLAVLAVLVWIRHHTNIRRLLNGTEPRIGRKA